MGCKPEVDHECAAGVRTGDHRTCAVDERARGAPAPLLQVAVLEPQEIMKVQLALRAALTRDFGERRVPRTLVRRDLVVPQTQLEKHVRWHVLRVFGVRRDARVRVCCGENRLRDRGLERETGLQCEARAERAGMDVRYVDQVMRSAGMLRVRAEYARGEADRVR